MPLLVRNLSDGPTVFSVLKDGVAIEWQGKDNPDGEDLQQVPDALVENVDFLKAVQRGVLVVEDAPDALKEMLAKQTDAFERRTSKAAQASRDAIDPAAHNDIVSTECIGPNNRGSGLCGAPVPVREKTKNERPPLCERHRQLEGQYVPEETDQMVDGKAVMRWVRVGVDAHDRQPV